MELSRVHVLYPRGVQTGGPEALHQLVDALRAHGVPAGLTPHPTSVGRSRVPAYAGYDAPETEGPLDRPGEVVIGPEVFLHELLRYRRARVFCWWLSIDNSRLFRTERYVAAWRQGLADPPGLRDVRALGSFALRPLRPWRSRLAGIEHLAQSHYARTFLRERAHLEAEMVSDYIRLPWERSASVAPRSGERPWIAFNPAKGHRLNSRVQGLVGTNASWDPIRGLSPDEVFQHLRRADVYLDLGGHPGKDRLPREAALAGAVTVVARRGSGAVAADTPLPEEHKVAVTGDVVRNAAAVLEAVLSDLPSAYEAQAGYRRQVEQQETTFRLEVGRLADRLRAGAREGRG